LSDPMYDITMAASTLKVIAPEQYDRLVDAFRQLEQKTIRELIAAPRDGIFGAQGRAALAEQLKARFENCLEQRAQYQNRT
jgi:hypothetical protein